MSDLKEERKLTWFQKYRVKKVFGNMKKKLKFWQEKEADLDKFRPLIIHDIEELYEIYEVESDTGAEILKEDLQYLKTEELIEIYKEMIVDLERVV